jgi:Zn-dependent metalloprotease
MCYGDGDGRIFIRFTKSVDVVGHELTHGVISHTCNLVYSNEPGALNEHFADVFGSLVKQWRRRQTAKRADWLIGADIMGPETTAKSLRTFKAEKAYENDPCWERSSAQTLNNKITAAATTGAAYNSGIPNHAVLPRRDGNWRQSMGNRLIWYKTMLLTLPAV